MKMRKGEKNKLIANRMNYLTGHLKANLKMLKGGRYCIDIIRQNQAVIAALKKVNELILKEHLDTCVTTAIRGKSEKDRKKVLEEIVLVFKEGESGK
ncbi:metal-sensing transcriptional repressor [Candidatus Shapirobacteria bacterium]|nr:metal-sensing transcriptional repressor [Candidatus Shapirobacteria bacterium]